LFVKSATTPIDRASFTIVTNWLDEAARRVAQAAKK
jgi:hypothetical protein